MTPQGRPGLQPRSVFLFSSGIEFDISSNQRDVILLQQSPSQHPSHPAHSHKMHKFCHVEDFERARDVNISGALGCRVLRPTHPLVEKTCLKCLEALSSVPRQRRSMAESSQCSSSVPLMTFRNSSRSSAVVNVLDIDPNIVVINCKIRMQLYCCGGS